MKQTKIIQYKNNTKMINFDDVANENIKKFNPNSPQIPDHSHRMLTIACSGS